jgi:hypothetical protein
MENIYEQFFFLKYSGGWSLSEAYNLPVGLREWFVKRLVKQIEQENEAVKAASQGSSSSRGQTQTLTAYNSPGPPPKQP